MEATYGVMGMMEWIALIPTANNMVRVRFSGGSLTGYGVTPATFTTSNPVMIKMIEESEYFRSGKIKLIKKGGTDPSVRSDFSSTGMVAFKKEKR